MVRDAKNLNITRDKALLYQTTDLLLECANLRMRLNEAELRALPRICFSLLIVVLIVVVFPFTAPFDLLSAKDDQKQKPLPATPTKPPPAAAAKSPSTTSSSPFKRVMGFFGSSQKVP